MLSQLQKMMRLISQIKFAGIVVGIVFFLLGLLLIVVGLTTTMRLPVPLHPNTIVSQSFALTDTHSAIGAPAIISSPTTSATHDSTNPSTDNNITLWVSIIGASAVILAAIIGLGVPVINHVLERRKAKKEEERQQQQTEALAKKLRESKENAQQQQVQNEQTRLQKYRQSLSDDPHISRLFTLKASQDLKIQDAYVQLRILPENVNSQLPLSYESDETTESEMLDSYLRIEKKYLEGRSGKALYPDEAVRRAKRCLVVGVPGAGKTTLLKHLTLMSATGQLIGIPNFPLYLELFRFNKTRYTDLFDFIASYWKDYNDLSKEEARKYIGAQLREGKILVLLDGLDETRIGANSEEADTMYTSAVEAINTFARDYPACHIVVTVRKAAYRHRQQLLSFNELEVINFRPEDIKQFVQNWFNTPNVEQKEEKIAGLKAQLERSPRIMALASNPLLLSLIVKVYERRLDLPESRANLYKQCVEMLLVEWDGLRGRFRYRGFDKDYKEQLLEDVAWHFHDLRRRFFPTTELLSVIADFLPAVSKPPEDNQEILKEIKTESGLLKEQNADYYSFSHLTFQEYFVSRYIIKYKDLQTLLLHIGDSWWEEVILLYAGASDIGDAGAFLNVLLGQDEHMPLQEDMFYTNLLLAGYCLSAKPTVRNVALRQQVVDKLFETLCTTRYILLQENVTNALAAVGDKETSFGREIFNRLLQFVREDSLDPDVLERIIYALGAFGETSLSKELIAILVDKEKRSNIRAMAAGALGMLGDHNSKKIMLSLLRDMDEDLYVRRSIAIAFGTLGDKSIVPDLLQLVCDDTMKKSGPVQSTSILTLGVLGDKEIIPPLLDLLKNDDTDTYVRGSIAVALDTLGDLSVIPTLLTLLSNQLLDRYIGQRITRALTSLQLDSNAVSTLLDLLANQNIDQSVRTSIASMLGKKGDTAIVKTLSKLLFDSSIVAPVRASIATALSVLKDQEIIRDMQELLHDPTLDMNVQTSVTAALVTLGVQKFVPTLIESLSKPLNQEVLLDATSALASLGSSCSIEERQKVVLKLVPLLTDKAIDRAVQQNIVSTLSVLAVKDITLDLLALLKNPDVERDVRRSIANVLPQLTLEEQELQEVVALLATTDIYNDLYPSLWSINRRRRAKNLLALTP